MLRFTTRKADGSIVYEEGQEANKDYDGFLKTLPQDLKAKAIHSHRKESPDAAARRTKISAPAQAPPLKHAAATSEQPESAAEEESKTSQASSTIPDEPAVRKSSAPIELSASGAAPAEITEHNAHSHLTSHQGLTSKSSKETLGGIWKRLHRGRKDGS